MRTRIDASKLELTETIVNIGRRVSKTVKGGKNMKFSVTVVEMRRPRRLALKL